MDADLNHGRTCSSKTFNSEPLCPNEDFIIASVEVWRFCDWDEHDYHHDDKNSIAFFGSSLFSMIYSALAYRS